MRAELERLRADLTLLEIVLAWIGFVIEQEITQEEPAVRPPRYALAA